MQKLTRQPDEAFCPWPGPQVQSTVRPNGDLGRTQTFWGGRELNRVLTTEQGEGLNLVLFPHALESPIYPVSPHPRVFTGSLLPKYPSVALHNLSHEE